jgi:DNA-directed RNA polymerase alpha subunit
MKDETIGETIDPTWMERTGGYAKDMTLRDWFAGMALQIYPDDKPSHMQLNVEQAYMQADLALKERSRNSSEEQPSSFDDWELTVRVENCLRADGINTVAKLLTYTQSDLLRIPNMGRKSVKEVVQEAARHGFTIKEYK